MAIRDLITSDPYYQNLVNPRGFQTNQNSQTPAYDPTTGVNYGRQDGTAYTAVEPQRGYQYTYGPDGTRYSIPIPGYTGETGPIAQPLNNGIMTSGNGEGGNGGIPTSTSGLIGDFMTATQNRTNNLTNPNKFQGILNSGMEMFGITPQRDIGEMIRSGQVDMRNTSGIPLGIGSAIGRMLPDKYYDMSLNDQVFTQSQMGYDGPTVFGENSMGNKDPFGLNVRSGFGNYGEAVAGNFNQLRDTLTKDRDGVTFNEETGMFEGLNADAVNQNTKLIRNKYLFRQKQLGVKNNLDAMIKESSQNRKIKAAEQLALQQAEKNRLESLIGTRINDGRSSSIVQTERGGNDRGTSRPSDHSGSVGLGSNAGNVRSANRAGKGSAQSYNQNLAYGGRVRYQDGGLASMFTRRR